MGAGREGRGEVFLGGVRRRERTSFLVELAEHFADDLPHALKRLEVVLGLIELLLGVLHLIAELTNPRVELLRDRTRFGRVGERSDGGGDDVRLEIFSRALKKSHPDLKRPGWARTGVATLADGRGRAADVAIRTLCCSMSRPYSLIAVCLGSGASTGVATSGVAMMALNVPRQALSTPAWRAPIDGPLPRVRVARAPRG